MSRIEYKSRQFTKESLAIIHVAEQIIEEYVQQGYDLTLRQLYYQFVARGIIPNKDSEYKRLGSIINDARLAGHIDWDHISDRTRNLRSLTRWESPAEILESAAGSYHVDRWKHQDCRIEVWIEKDALVGVIENVCNEFDAPFFSCRGYTSQSAMWRAAQRLLDYNNNNQKAIILHLGDHDPSGVDMTRDIIDRLYLFEVDNLIVKRIALNYDQIEKYKPPPNPAKITDSRSSSYIKKFGRESWELDALEPSAITALIHNNIIEHIDKPTWDEMEIKETAGKHLLEKMANNWDKVSDMLSE